MFAELLGIDEPVVLPPVVLTEAPELRSVFTGEIIELKVSEQVCVKELGPTPQPCRRYYIRQGHSVVPDEDALARVGHAWFPGLLRPETDLPVALSQTRDDAERVGAAIRVRVAEIDPESLVASWATRSDDWKRKLALAHEVGGRWVRAQVWWMEGAILLEASLETQAVQAQDLTSLETFRKAFGSDSDCRTRTYEDGATLTCRPNVPIGMRANGLFFSEARQEMSVMTIVEPSITPR